VRVLLKAGAVVDATDDDGDTALMLATRSDNEEVVRMMLKAGAVAVDETKTLGQTALMYAVEFVSEEVVRMLLKTTSEGAAVEAEDNKCGDTALLLAARKS
jgi:ankyrin repeat protein